MAVVLTLMYVALMFWEICLKIKYAFMWVFNKLLFIIKTHSITKLMVESKEAKKV